MANPYSGQIFSELVSGNLFQADQITGPFICIVGTASSGPSYTLKKVSSAQEAATLFEEDGDTDTPFLRDIALALQEGGEAITLYAMRIGGSQGSILFTQTSATGTLKITPQYEDAEAFDKYKICLMESTLSAGIQRILIYDTDLDAIIYDSDLIIVPDLGLITVELSGSWDGYYEFGLDNNSQPDFSLAPTLTELHTTPSDYFNATNHSGTDTATLTTKVDPTDGKNLSKPAQYACLEKAYGLISTRYMDYIVPSGVYFDAPNITDTTDGRDISQATSSQKVYDSANVDWSDADLIQGDATKDILGYLWQYKYKGTKYVFMTHASDLFTGTTTLDTIADIGGTRAAADGTFKYAPGGVPSNSITIEVDWAAMVKLLTVESGGEIYKIKNIVLNIVNSTDDSDGSAHGLTTTCHLDEDFDTTTETLTLRLAADVTGNGPTIPLSTVQSVLEASDYVSAVKFYDSAGSEITGLTSVDYFHTLSAPYAGTDFKVGQYWLTHKELTGEDIPSKVWSKLIDDGSNAQLREVSFGHQLAQFCYYASTSYHMCLGFISFSEPDGYGKVKLANFMGALPEYQGWGGKLTDEAIKAVGEGILGNKFLAGSIGYRGNELKGGSASQGYAYGGLVCTKGLSLPNKEPYGIAQGDEKKDKNKFPVDIGRHIVVSASWPICSFSLSGTTVAARHSIAALLAAKVFVTPVNQEPFGDVNGAIRANVLLTDPEQQLVADGYAADCRIARITMLDSASIGGTNYITNISTAAHWKDDFKRISTIRCVNRVVNGLRSLAKRYIGSSFNSAMITSLQSAINGYLKSEQDVGVHQGAIATLSYTRADRINGNLKITLKMVPPFALETIEITTSVAADASEL